MTVLLAIACFAGGCSQAPRHGEEQLEQGDVKGKTWSLTAYAAGEEPCLLVRLEKTQILDHCAGDVTAEEPYAELIDIDAVPFVVGIAPSGSREASVEYTIGGFDQGPATQDVRVMQAGHGRGGYFVAAMAKGARLENVRAR
jgi:hypothetical protein